MNSTCLQLRGKNLKSNQKRIAEYIRNPNRRGLIAFHGTGSGKTLAAIAAISCFLHDNPRSHVYVLTPTSVKEQFENELEGVGLLTDRVHVYPHVTFVLRFKEDKVPFVHGSMIVVDEAHLFANVDAVKVYKLEDEPRASTLYRACQRARKVLLLTATPAVNVAKQMYNYIKLIEGRHITPKRSMDAVYDDVKCYVSYYKKASDDSDYPEKEIHIKRFDMPPSYLSKYNKIETQTREDMEEDGKDTKKNLKPFLTGVRRASNRIDGEENPKVQYLVREILKNPQLRTVIYSSWRAAGVDYVQEKLRAQRISFNEITGGSSKTKRKEAREAFNKGTTPVLFITAAGAEGVDLKGCRRIYILEPYWTQSRHEQVIGRGVRFQSHIHLPPSERKVDVYYLVLQKPDNDNNNNSNNNNDFDELDFLSADDQVMLMCYKKGLKINQLYERLSLGDYRSPDCQTR